MDTQRTSKGQCDGDRMPGTRWMIAIEAYRGMVRMDHIHSRTPIGCGASTPRPRCSAEERTHHLDGDNHHEPGDRHRREEAKGGAPAAPPSDLAGAARLRHD